MRSRHKPAELGGLYRLLRKENNQTILSDLSLLFMDIKMWRESNE